ncbi:amidase [Bradyrhizobium iriomotense]|uniref:Glutamyl-tRNA amidotransferase subunit A n=1 Tax=Bradyrhizobium iriomotense TaxID=441950 RepID=A0ABQ6B9W2_9BRAD|nr:amidase [Bradyrhizobium iriomotense]GLR90286.1 glutamyl-tRNA amidotransferase subunit A [Bradyrhizobium iriomotense]
MQPIASAPSADPARLSAREAVRAIREGRLTALSLVEACLNRIAAREPEIRAWSFFDRDVACEQARRADARQAVGEPLGPLHGLPVGVKDVFDTADMPSEYGSALYRARLPEADAAAVSKLREAGAIILGKTATSEFGMYHPPPTRNPHDLLRSPGVSSSGSAAAVVDYMTPLALGTQHTASTTLPASFCGAFAFKPSLGFTEMTGSNILVPRLAHLGLLGRSVDDLALFAGAFNPMLVELGPVEKFPSPRIAFVRGPGWTSVTVDAVTALKTLQSRIRMPIPELILPPEFDRAVEVTMGLLDAHLAFRFGGLPVEDFAQLCSPLQAGVQNGKSMSAPRYLEFDALADRLTALADGLFAEHDLLITLSTLGEATRLEEGPGSGVMSMPWSLCGLPTLSLPLLRGKQGLPIGLQLIGPKGRDRSLLHAAAWVVAETSPITLHQA